MSDLILTLSTPPLFEIILNRPDKRNAINWPMFAGLGDAIDRAEQAPNIRVVLIRGEGPGFSSGIDLTSFAELDETFGANWQRRMLSVTAAFQSILNKVERCSLPTIALLHGYALGLGCELALACDFRFAARHTRIGLPETRLGLIPDVGGTTRLTRLIGPARAKELIMTGRSIDLDLAEHWGLVNAVVPIEELRARAQALVTEIVLAAPMAVRLAKRVIDGLSDIDRGLQLEAWAQSQLIRSEDFQIGVRAMLAKTQPQWLDQ